MTRYGADGEPWWAYLEPRKMWLLAIGVNVVLGLANLWVVVSQPGTQWASAIAAPAHGFIVVWTVQIRKWLQADHE